MNSKADGFCHELKFQRLGANFPSCLLSAAPNKEEEKVVPMDTGGGDPLPQCEGEEEPPAEEGVGMDDGGCSKDKREPGKGPHPQCMPERAALIKSILNFLKKAIPDATFAENIRSRKLAYILQLNYIIPSQRQSPPNYIRYSWFQLF